MATRPARLTKVFLAALAIRWVYNLALYVNMGEAGIQGVDSTAYLGTAYKFAAAIASGSVEGFAWLGPDPGTMPLFTWLITLLALIFGNWLPLAFVMTQGVIDAGTCLLVGGIARTFDQRYALPAAVIAALNPTQIVLAGLVYTDTMFVFFVAVFLLGSVRWLAAPSWRDAILVGGGLGGAALVRILAAPWGGILLVFLFAVVTTTRRLSFPRLAQLAAAGAIVALCVGAVLWRNVAVYGAWQLTPQGGVHLADWVVPLAQEARDGTPWTQTVEKLEARKRERFGPPSTNPFEEDRRYREIGTEALRDIPFSALAKSWALGAAINLGSPGVILSPAVSQLPRTGFYATPGASSFDKVRNFLFRSDNALYAWILLLGIGGVAVARALQAVGLFAIWRARRNRPALILFVIWSAYILAINGGVASPKYRLPIEPVLVIAFAAGFCLLASPRILNKS